MYRLSVMDGKGATSRQLQELIAQHYPSRLTFLPSHPSSEAPGQEEERPDILILDEGPSGFGLARELLAQDPYLQVIFLAESESFSSLQEAMKLGARGYLLKPLREEELWEILDRCLKSLDAAQERRRIELRLSEGFQRLDRYARKNIF